MDECCLTYLPVTAQQCIFGACVNEHNFFFLGKLLKLNNLLINTLVVDMIEKNNFKLSLFLFF